ncbi:MAG: hypothetical protein Q9201_000289 [Fulgogasparrea decipioides]
MPSRPMVAATAQFTPHGNTTNAPAGTKRPRSSRSGSVSSSRRTKSRASTTSIASSGTQPIFEHHQPTDTSHGLPFQHATNQPFQFNPEDMLTHSEQQLTNPHPEYPFDPSLQRHAEPARNAYVHENNTSLGQGTNTGSAVQRPSFSQHHSFNGRENQGFEYANGEQVVDDNGTSDAARKKKGNASSIANDIELKKLFRENVGRSLKEVAASVLANERGPRSEKTKQIFAMLWLNSVCRRGTGSVPRNRVFSHYATRCGTERVPPLNPASFGKLVRIIFPGILTRRLGMRGESKYHYVDLSLVEEPPEAGEAVTSFAARDSYMETGRSRGLHLPADTAVFPSPDEPISSTFGTFQAEHKVPECLYLQTASSSMQEAPSRPNMVNYELKFAHMGDPPTRDDEPPVLPDIHSYVPIGTDPDTADALSALYRSHCISLIDSLRYCKERMFWHHYTSFHGTLTVPVQKLFAHPSMANWIKECDWLMYQKMVKDVSPLALSVVPMRAIEAFRSISTKLASHLMQTFQNHPQHVRDARLGPATVFAGLLDRLLRVNATAHAAANMLTNDANRDQMWYDWVLHVKPTKVVESSLPGIGYQRTLRILATEMRHLLGPLRTATYGGMDPIYAETLNESGHGHQEADSNTAGVLDRWTSFLRTLPSLFPRADARTLLHCAGAVGNAALRDITIAQALSFGSWWVTKTWVDEMLLWMAEKGGFLEHTPETLRMREQSRAAVEVNFPPDDASEVFGGSRPRTGVSESVDAPSRFGTVDVSNDFTRDQSRGTSVPFHENYFRRDPRPAPVPHVSRTQTHQEKMIELGGGQNPDDSGIGMEPEHDELHKDHYSGFVAEGTNIASDPADVVVC